MSQSKLNFLPFGAAIGVFFIVVATVISFSPHSSPRTFAQQGPNNEAIAATSTLESVAMSTAVDTSTPVLNLIRTPNEDTGEVDLRLEWTTTRTDLYPQFVVMRRPPSKEPWSFNDIVHALSTSSPSYQDAYASGQSGQTFHHLGSESELFTDTSTPVQFAIRFVSRPPGGEPALVYSNSITLSPPREGGTATTPPAVATTTPETSTSPADTSTPVLNLIRTPNEDTGEVDLGLEWTTTRTDLTPLRIVYRRPPSEEPWVFFDKWYNTSSRSQSVSTVSRWFRNSTTTVEFAVSFLTNSAGEAVYSNSITLSPPREGETATTTPVLNLIRTPNEDTGEVDLQLEWTTTRTDLTPLRVVYRRPPSEEPWVLGQYDSSNISSGSSSRNLHTLSDWFRISTTAVEFVVLFRDTANKEQVYSNSVTLRPLAGTSIPESVDTSTPVLNLIRTRIESTGEVDLRLEWTTTRTDLTAGTYIHRRPPSDEPWDWTKHSQSSLSNATSSSQSLSRTLSDWFRTSTTTVEFAVAFLTNSTGEAVYSNSVTLRPPVPSAPRKLSDAIMLIWEADPDPLVTGYQILRRIKDGGDYSVLVENTGDTDKYYVDTSAVYGVTYEYVIKSVSELLGVSPPSNPIAAVRIKRGSPLLATALNVPDHHSQSNFTFELRFSETPKDGLSYVTLRDAFDVTGGTMVTAKRVVPGKNIRWNITVKPSGDGAVTVVLPAARTDCTEEGAICTADGRPLFNRVEVTVPRFVPRFGR